MPRLTDSSVATAIYTILAAAPTFKPVRRYVLRSADGDLSSTTTGATIRYTTDGSAPNETRSVYAAPFTVSGTTT